MSENEPPQLGVDRIVLLRLDRDGRDVSDLPGLWSEDDRLYVPFNDPRTGDKETVAAMTADARRRCHAELMQALINCRLNAFAFDLIAESLLKSAAPKRIDFVFPIARSDCAAWAGVRFTLEPIAVEQ